jgi:hypothetical protein
MGEMYSTINAFTCNVHSRVLTNAALKISSKSIYYYLFISPNI